MEFPGFLGNAPVKEALSRAFSAGRFPHALLLQGEPGTGKGAFAQLVAQALVCRRKDRAPCGECPSCVRAKAGSHPDIRVVEGSGATRSLTVEQVKELTADAYRAPEEADVSVYILQMGTKPLEPAQNKLLKLIEEPPGPRGVPAAVPFRRAAAAHHPQPGAELFAPAPRGGGGRPLSWPPGRTCLWSAPGNWPGSAGATSAGCSRSWPAGRRPRPFPLPWPWPRACWRQGSIPCCWRRPPLQKDRELFREVLARLSAIFRDGLVLRAGGSSLLGGAPPAGGQAGGFAHEAAYPAARRGGGGPARAWSATPTWRCW